MEKTEFPILLERATEAMNAAYAPYSNFKVGAAILGSRGGIYAGCNVENSSYPVGMCAERGAISAAIVAGETKITGVVIVADSEVPCPPCGMCRQALAEFDQDMVIFMVARNGQVDVAPLKDLLPKQFDQTLLSPGH